MRQRSSALTKHTPENVRESSFIPYQNKWKNIHTHLNASLLASKKLNNVLANFQNLSLSHASSSRKFQRHFQILGFFGAHSSSQSQASALSPRSAQPGRKKAKQYISRHALWNKNERVLKVSKPFPLRGG